MRNVASKHLQNDDVDDFKITESNKWGSLPALNLMDKEGYRSEEDADLQVNEDEGLQEVIIHGFFCFEKRIFLT